jgi:hypothetical protein
VPERKAPPVRLVPPALKDLLARRVPLVLLVLLARWVLPVLREPKERLVKPARLAKQVPQGQLVLPVRPEQPAPQVQQER